MHNCKASSTPMYINEKFQCDDGFGDAEDGRYINLIVRLIYLTHSRLDISYIMEELSRYMDRPSRFHVEAAKRVLRYLAGIVDYGLNYTHASECRLVGFSYIDWGGNMDDQKSTTGVVFSLGLGVITWMSKKQEVIALLTIEAEYIANSSPACQCF